MEKFTPLAKKISLPLAVTAVTNITSGITKYLVLTCTSSSNKYFQVTCKQSITNHQEETNICKSIFGRCVILVW